MDSRTVFMISFLVNFDSKIENIDLWREIKFLLNDP